MCATVMVLGLMLISVDYVLSWVKRSPFSHVQVVVSVVRRTLSSSRRNMPPLTTFLLIMIVQASLQNNNKLMHWGIICRVRL
jgi:hypothetical protein